MSRHHAVVSRHVLPSWRSSLMQGSFPLIEIATPSCRIVARAAVLEIFADAGFFSGSSRPILPLQKSPQRCLLQRTSPATISTATQLSQRSPATCVAFCNMCCLLGDVLATRQIGSLMRHHMWSPPLGGCLPILRRNGDAIWMIACQSCDCMVSRH